MHARLQLHTAVRAEGLARALREITEQKIKIDERIIHEGGGPSSVDRLQSLVGFVAVPVRLLDFSRLPSGRSVCCVTPDLGDVMRPR
jgi:hypothetical protein